jgi:murein DD-endopeptidase MepM/ murein hydrolase activator NlpD
MRSRLVLILFILIATSTTSWALSAEVYPSAVLQGDPFVIKVSAPAGMSLRAKYGDKEIFLGKCGFQCYEAVGSVDLEAQPGELRIALYDGGVMQQYLTLEVMQGEFRRQEITLPADKVNLSPEDDARAEREAAMLRALWKRHSPLKWDSPFIMPLLNEYSTEFGVIRIMNKTKRSRHSGLDIRGAAGTPVLAANNGIVMVAENLFFGGNSIVIDHGQRVYSVYMHLSAINVEPGSKVSKGTVVGLVGSTGRSTGPHLHYTLKVDAENANPESATRLPLGPFKETVANVEDTKEATP